MGGSQWTVKALGDKEFLISMGPEWLRLRGEGKARKRNPAKDAYVAKVCDQYDEKFPGRIASFDFTEIGLGGTEDDRKEKMCEKINHWYGNFYRDTNAGGREKQEIIDLSGKKNIGRKEKAFDTYARLYKARIDPLLVIAYREHLAECDKAGGTPKSEIAFRNKQLSAMLKDESEEVQKNVQQNQRTAEEKQAKVMPQWDDEETCTAEELARRRKAFKRHQDLLGMVRTLERAGSAFQELGWNSVILVGGPDPKMGGKIRAIGMTNGCTIPGKDEDIGKTFEEYYPGWQKTMDWFTDFCGETSTVEEREALTLTLHNQTKPGVKPEVTDPTIPANTPSHQPEPTANSNPTETAPSPPEDNATMGTNLALTADTPKLAEPIVIDTGNDKSIFIDTGDDTGHFTTKEFGGQVYKYRVPHKGDKLSLQQMNDNAKVFNKVLAIVTDVRGMAAATTVKKVKEVRKHGRGGECDEEGAEPSLKENRRVTRSAASVAEAQAEAVAATPDPDHHPLAPSTPESNLESGTADTALSSSTPPTPDDHTGPITGDSLCSKVDTTKTDTTASSEPAAIAQPIPITQPAISEPAAIAQPVPITQPASSEPAAIAQPVPITQPASSEPEAIAQPVPITQPAPVPPSTDVAEQRDSVLSACDTNIPAASSAPSADPKKPARKPRGKRKTPEPAPESEKEPANDAPPAKRKRFIKTNKYNL